MRRALSIAFLRECFHLDAVGGDLYWLERPRSHFATDQAHVRFNSVHSNTRADLATYPLNGYRRVRIRFDGERFDLCAHRVVYAMAHGTWPTYEIDHIDGSRINNSPSNLRDVTHRVNMNNLAVHRVTPVATAMPDSSLRAFGDGFTPRAYGLGLSLPLTAQALQSVVIYDPETGVFTWRVSPSRKWPVGAIAGTLTKKGYVRTSRSTKVLKT